GSNFFLPVKNFIKQRLRQMSIRAIAQITVEWEAYVQQDGGTLKLEFDTTASHLMCTSMNTDPH
ncbi:MAG: hypothetical protein JW902_06150, partial [Syntrophaceae bacterium]|nr:hypothetical protein [Syntrophaceae bacterium]